MYNQLKYYKFLLFFILLALFFPAAALRDFHSRGEGREALVIQNMLSEGQYVLAEGYAGDVPSKPPLLHWFGLVCSLLYGHLSEFSTRLPSCLAAIFIGMWFFKFLSRYRNDWESFCVACILSSSFEWLRAATTTRVDMLLCACVVVALTEIFLWVSKDFRGYPWILSIAIFFAILAKGPVGAVLPAFIFFSFSLVSGKALKSIFLRACLVFVPAAVLASGWYLAAYHQRPEEFLSKVYYENIARFLGQQEDEPHKASVFKLYLSVLIGFMPWSLLFLYEGFFLRFWKKYKWSALKLSFISLDQIQKFSLIVVICTLFFYSIPESKRPVYLLPMYPFLALFVSQAILSLCRLKSIKIYNRLVALVALLCIMILPIALVVEYISDIEIAKSFSSYFVEHILLVWIWLIASILLSFMCLRTVFYKSTEVDTSQVLIKKSVLLFVSVNLFIQILIVPAIINPISAKRFVEKLPQEIKEAPRLISFGEEFYSISFYSSRRFLRAKNEVLKSGDIVFVSHKHLSEFVEKGYKYKMIYQSEGSVISFGNYISVLKIIE